MTQDKKIKNFNIIKTKVLYSIEISNEGKYFAISNENPYFCFTGKSIKKVTKRANKALKYYENYLEKSAA